MSKNMKKVFVIVLDSLGIGAAPDAIDFGDEGADTLGRISKSKCFKIPNLTALGLGNIDGVEAAASVDSPLASVCRLTELSRGKDTTVGHWELMGVVSDKPFPTYPDGFPSEIIEKFEQAVGRGVLCNKPYSGTEVIKDYGEEHLKTGKLIVYTSEDSVFQIAAHEDKVSINELYSYCEKAREILTGSHSVGRVIARPFVGEIGNFTRTANRRDFSLVPPATALDKIKEAGLDVISVGKIYDIFAGRGITEKNPTHSNQEGVAVIDSIQKRDFRGLCFANLVDFDMLYGHRQDIDGYAGALAEFDLWLGGFISRLGDDEALIITADHGCDPGDDSTDHTREYVPCIIYNKERKAENYGTKNGFSFVGESVLRMLGVKN